MNQSKNDKKQTKNMLVTMAMVVAAYAVIQVVELSGGLSSLLSGLLVPLCIYSVTAVALNLCVGYLGELSLGHAGFMCVGAFSSAFFTKLTMDAIPNEYLRFFLATLVGVAVAALFGLLVSFPVLRLKGDYLAIVTLAFGEIIKNIVNVLYIGKDGNGLHFSIKDQASLQMESDGKMIINGALGITGTPKQSTFTVGIIMLLVALFVVFHFVNSRSGRAVKAIRDNQIAAESIGIDIKKYKLIAFTLSAALAGMGGVLYAHNLSSLTALPKNFGYNMSIMILVFVVLGGIGNFRGSIIAAVVLTLLPELLRGLSDYRMLMYAVVLIVMMLFNWAPKCLEWRSKYSLKRLLGGKTKEVS